MQTPLAGPSLQKVLSRHTKKSLGRIIIANFNNELVTVIIPTYNRANSIGECLKAMQAQTYSNIEIIISDDNSRDDTVNRIKKIADERVRILCSNFNSGPATARNKAIRKAKGSIIFFTDDDVIVPNSWIESGLKSFKDESVLGVEGKITYVSETYKPCYSDRIVQNTTGELYMTANIAYRKTTLLKVGLFDTEMRQYEDRCLAFKILKYGSIIFNPTFTVTHQKETYTVSSFFAEASKVKYRVLSLDKIQDNTYFSGHFYQPLKYLFMIMPPLLLARIHTHRFDNFLDWKLLVLAYPRFYYERYILWSSAIKAKRFLL